MMTVQEALEIIDSVLYDNTADRPKLNIDDAFKLADVLIKNVNEAFELGRLDKAVVG